MKVSYGHSASSRPSGSSPLSSRTQVPCPEYVMTTVSPEPAPASLRRMPAKWFLVDGRSVEDVYPLSSSDQSCASFTQPARSLPVPG